MFQKKAQFIKGQVCEGIILPSQHHYLGTGDQLRGGECTLRSCSNHSVLQNSVLGHLGHILRLQYQHGSSIGHSFGKAHQHILGRGQAKANRKEGS